MVGPNHPVTLPAEKIIVTQSISISRELMLGGEPGNLAQSRKSRDVNANMVRVIHKKDDVVQDRKHPKFTPKRSTPVLLERT